MKSIILYALFFAVSFFTVISFAQGEAAVPFLLLQPSPSLSAMGQTGTALPTDDPFGFIWNPAQVGYTSQHNNLLFIFYPSKIEWLQTFNLGLEVTGSAFNAGYNFKDLIGFPLSAGFGYSNVQMDYSSLVLDIVYPLNIYNAYSFGIGINYFVQFNAGFTYKEVTTEFVSHPAYTVAEATVIDVGFC